jgi:hypothetical protein
MGHGTRPIQGIQATDPVERAVKIAQKFEVGDEVVIHGTITEIRKGYTVRPSFEYSYIPTTEIKVLVRGCAREVWLLKSSVAKEKNT